MENAARPAGDSSDSDSNRDALSSAHIHLHVLAEEWKQGFELKRQRTLQQEQELLKGIFPEGDQWLRAEERAPWHWPGIPAATDRDHDPNNNTEEILTDTRETALYKNLRFKRFVDQMLSMLVPVMISQLVMLGYVYLIAVHIPVEERLIASTLVYKHQPQHSFGKELLGGMANAGVIVSIIVALTCLLVTLYVVPWRHGVSVLHAIMQTFIALGLFFAYAVFGRQFVLLYDLSVDSVTFVVLLLNFAAVGCHVICTHVKAQDLLTHAYLLSFALAVAWPLTELDPLSLGCTLLFLLLWDIMAVSLPCGPIKYAVKRINILQATRPLPALMYSSQTFMLGMGDFIFYSTLVSLAASSSTPWAILTSSIGVLVGVAFTITVTVVRRLKVFPALPFSLTLGLLFLLLAPMLAQFSQVVGLQACGVRI